MYLFLSFPRVPIIRANERVFWTGLSNIFSRRIIIELRLFRIRITVFLCVCKTTWTVSKFFFFFLSCKKRQIQKLSMILLKKRKRKKTWYKKKTKRIFILLLGSFNFDFFHLIFYIWHILYYRNAKISIFPNVFRARPSDSFCSNRIFRLLHDEYMWRWFSISNWWLSEKLYAYRWIFMRI